MDNIQSKPEEPVALYKPPYRLVSAVEDFSAKQPLTVTVEGSHAAQREDVASLLAAFLTNTFKKNRVFLRKAERPSWSAAEEGEQDLIAHLTSEDNSGGIGVGGGLVEREFDNILVRDGSADHPTWTMDPPSFEIPDDGLMFLDAERKTTGPVPFLFPTEAFAYVGKKLAVTAIAAKVIESNSELVVRLDSPVIFEPKNAMIEAEQQIRKVIRNTESLNNDIIPARGIRTPAAKAPGNTLFGTGEEREGRAVEVAVHLSLAIDCIHHTIDYAITNIPLLRGKRSKLVPLGLVIELIDEPEVE